MSCKDTKEHYGCVTKWLHSVALVLIFLQLLGGLFLDDFSGALRGDIFTLHKSVGIVIFFLMVFFLFWRLINTKPTWPASMPSWERYLARITHVCLFLGFIVMPFSGWVMATAAGKPPHFFWLFSFPFPGIAQSKMIAGMASETHEILAWALFLVIGLHILGAFKHHFISKDTILKRMCPKSGS